MKALKIIPIVSDGNTELTELDLIAIRSVKPTINIYLGEASFGVISDATPMSMLVGETIKASNETFPVITSKMGAESELELKNYVGKNVQAENDFVVVASKKCLAYCTSSLREMLKLFNANDKVEITTPLEIFK